MQAVVLAAGQGTRMGPLTENRPKPMLPVAGRPLIEHVLDACHPHVDEYLLVVGYENDQLQSHFGGSYRGIPISYVIQDDQLGTSHAVGCAEPAVTEDFLVLNGDVCIDPDLIDRLVEAGGPAVTAMPVDEPENYGVFGTQDGCVTDIQEKPTDPPTNLANLGLYRLSPDIFTHVQATEQSPRGEYELTDSLQAYIDDGNELQVVEHTGRWLDVGRPWELLEATSAILADLEPDASGDVAEGATVHHPVVVEEGATVRDGVVLQGPVVVKSGAEIGPNAYVRDGTVIGENVRIGHSVEIKNSIIMEETNVAHLSYVGDSVLGTEVNFGAGTTVANLRHDEESIAVTVKGERVDTGRRKFGVVVGDGVKTAINTSLNAGITLGTEATTNPGETVLEDRGIQYRVEQALTERH